MKTNIADALTLSRLLLLVPWIECWISGNGACLPIIAAMIASDILDGIVARRSGTASRRGALFDAGCDAIIAIAASIALAAKEARFLYLAGLMVACFASWLVGGAVTGRLAFSRLGRYDGAACYTILAYESAVLALAGLGFAMPRFIAWIAWIPVAALLLASMVENVITIASQYVDRSRLGRRASVPERTEKGIG